MIATDFHLIPLSTLCKHEQTVLQRLDLVPTVYARSLLEKPEIRYPFLYYVLFTHLSDLLPGVSPEELFLNRYYWFLRMSKQHEIDHDFDAGYEKEAAGMVEYGEATFDRQMLEDIEKKVDFELATNEKELPVAFSDFSTKRVLKAFGLALNESADYFHGAVPATISALLRETLTENVNLAIAISTEKARSELIVAPVLLEIRRHLKNSISLFSGIDLDVDPDNGLRGTFDFMLCLSPHQLIVKSPILTVVEVKKNDPGAGFGQCIAEMLAARIFNLQNGVELPAIYGVVTTGTNWRFLRLIESTVYIDASEYHIKEVERIVGIIVSMFADRGASAAN